MNQAEVALTMQVQDQSGDDARLKTVDPTPPRSLVYGTGTASAPTHRSSLQSSSSNPIGSDAGNGKCRRSRWMVMSCLSHSTVSWVKRADADKNWILGGSGMGIE